MSERNDEKPGTEQDLRAIIELKAIIEQIDQQMMKLVASYSDGDIDYTGASTMDLLRWIASRLESDKAAIDRLKRDIADLKKEIDRMRGKDWRSLARREAMRVLDNSTLPMGEVMQAIDILRSLEAPHLWGQPNAALATPTPKDAADDGAEKLPL